jgi:hypothetical protein
MKRFLLSFAAIGLFLAACSGAAPTPFAVVASSNGSIGTGDQRVLFALIDRESDEYMAEENRPATMTLRDENGSPIEEYPMTFVWTVPDVRGIYAANIFVPEAGVYQVTIDTEGYETAGPVGLVTTDDSPVVQVGETAPASVTKTAAEYPDLSVISSDPEPDPAMYQLSVDEAVSNGSPSVIVFATPAWCVSETCGPLLLQVKGLRSGYQGVDFVHVEVYDDIQVSSFEELEVVESVVEWGLVAEPWVYVVDKDGIVTGSFEGAASDDELRTAIDEVAG